MLLAGLVALVLAGARADALEVMPLSEVRPGMVGVGRTVFEGTRIDEFQVEVIGVLENAVGRRLTRPEDQWITRLSPAWQRRLYVYGLERGSWDAWMQRLAVAPFVRLFQRCDRWERRWTNWLNGVRAETPAAAAHHAESLGESP